MERKLLERNVKLYTPYILFGEPVFWGAVLVTSIMLLGNMPLQDVYVMEAIVMLGFSVVEVHTGALADVVGKKNTIVFGKLLEVIGMVWFARMTSVFDAWGANCVFMLGVSFCSGSDRALLVATLKKLGYEEEGAKSMFRRITGVTQSHRLLLAAFASLCTGYLAEIDVRIPLYLSIPPMIICFCVSCFFTEVSNGTNSDQKKESFFEEIRKTVFGGFFLFIKTKAMVWIALTTALLEISSKIWFFSYNPYFELVHIQYRYYGFIFFFLNLIAWFFSKYSSFIIERVSGSVLLYTMVTTIGVPILLMGTFTHPILASFVLFQNFTRGVSRPFFETELHHLIVSEELRATLDSVKSAIHRSLEALCLLLYHFALDSSSLSSALLFTGCIVLVFGSLSITTYKKIFG